MVPTTVGLTVRYAGELAPPGEVGKCYGHPEFIDLPLGPNEEQTSMLSFRDMKPTSWLTNQQ